MKLKRAYLTRTLQMGQFTMRSLDGGENETSGWTLNLHPKMGALSIRLGEDTLYVPLVHVESFELCATAPEAAPEPEPEPEVVAPERRGPGRPRIKRAFADQ